MTLKTKTRRLLLEMLRWSPVVATALLLALGSTDHPAAAQDETAISVPVERIGHAKTPAGRGFTVYRFRDQDVTCFLLWATPDSLSCVKD